MLYIFFAILAMDRPIFPIAEMTQSSRVNHSVMTWLDAFHGVDAFALVFRNHNGYVLISCSL